MNSIAANELNALSPGEILEIQKEVAYYRNKYQVNRFVGESIFSILEQEARVLYYPIENPEICAFFRKVDGRQFVFINTAIPYEKQIFAAAHELAHIWSIGSPKIRQSEILYANAMNGYAGESGTAQSALVDHAEQIANRFAAEFLVETHELQEAIRKYKIPEFTSRNGDWRKDDSDRLSHLIKGVLTLMDIFTVPYKTIVRRLFEIDRLDRSLCEALLTVQARAENSPIRMFQQRFHLCEKNNEVSRRKKLDNFVDLSLTAYENHLITYEKLESLLELENKTPMMFRINPPEEERMSEEELEARLAEDE